MVKAIGLRNKKKLEVVCEKQDGLWRFSFNGKRDFELESSIQRLLFDDHPIMGTYWPVCDALKIAAALELFFDRGGVEEIDVDDPEAKKELSDVESEEGVVY